MWEENIDPLPPTCSPTRDWTHNLGMCSEQESSQQSFHLQDDVPPNWSTLARAVFWPFKRTSVFLADSHLSLVERIPADFHSQMLCGHLFPALVFWAREPGLGFRFYTSQMEPLQIRYLSESQPLPVGVGHPFSHLHPSYQFQSGIFHTSLVIRLLLS